MLPRISVERHTPEACSKQKAADYLLFSHVAADAILQRATYLMRAISNLFLVLTLHNTEFIIACAKRPRASQNNASATLCDATCYRPTHFGWHLYRLLFSYPLDTSKAAGSINYAII